MWFPWLFFSKAGDSAVVVDVPSGGVVGVRWNAPWLVFLAGKFTVLGVRSATAGPPPQAGMAMTTPASQAAAVSQAAAAPQPAPAAPAAPQPAAVSPVAAQTPVAAQPTGWFPDPSGRHQLRYWDGTAWSQHVADNGVMATD